MASTARKFAVLLAALALVASVAIGGASANPHNPGIAYHQTSIGTAIHALKAVPVPDVLCGPGCDPGGRPPPYTCNSYNLWAYTYWPNPPYRWQCVPKYGGGYIWVLI